MKKAWVNFAELRRSLDFTAVLKHYGVEVREKKSGQHHGFCPLPSHNGSKRSPSFSAHLKRGVFRCFGCRTTGNVIEFATRMSGLDPKNPADLRTVALKLQDLFGKAPTCAPDAGPNELSRSAPEKVVTNPHLDFQLQRLDPKHPYLKERGFSFRTMEHFGVGFCKLGLFGGRVAIPLHTPEGHLVGYAGRAIDDTAITGDNPKYKFPSRRERKGAVYEFRKSLILYNAHRMKSPVKDLIVVEGFPSTWWLWQWGYPATVAVMGSSCSEEQAKIIVSIVHSSGTVWVMTDGNTAGEECAADILMRVAPHRLVRSVRLLPGDQPTDLTPGDLSKVLWPT